MLALALAAGACSSPSTRSTASPAPADVRSDASASSASSTPAFDLGVLGRAEDLRRSNDVPPAAQRDHDPQVRRRAARAFARILDADDAPLLRALNDEDEEVVAWAGYGLGESCKEQPDTHVRALAVRLGELEPARPVATPIDARVAILRALGRCAGDVAEQTLRAWLRRADASPPTAEAAAFALGEASSRRGSLSLESIGTLLEAAQRQPAVDAALYAFGRVDAAEDEAVSLRLLAAAQPALARPGPARFFAIRALGRSGPGAASDLARVLSSNDYLPAERAEAARSLARLPKAGQAALADGLAALVPGNAAALSGHLHGVLMAAVRALADDLPPRGESALRAVMRLQAPADARAPLLRRISSLRCAAAEKLARGAWDADVLRSCDVGDGVAAERARLVALDRGPLTRSRRAPWLELTRSSHVQVQEAAIDAIARHPELGDAALAVLARALGSARAGVVATAADVVHAHPDRCFVLAASERRAALDPRSPPPGAHPAREIDPGILRAMRAALSHPWTPDLTETRVALLDAALALQLDEGQAYAQAACHDPDATVRARAARALAAAGTKGASCLAPASPGDPAPELDAPLGHATRVVFDTDAGVLGIRFDPALAPVAATRFVALARSGFYTGVSVHRVVPAFVAQLGDRGGDGFGGSGDVLRCETSPVAFAPLDVGVALAGRDTGSSQLFVALARHPHLDGQYAWVGHADGDWDSVVEGDVIRAVRVEE